MNTSPAAGDECDDRDLYCTPHDWVQPAWWTAELDNAHPLARYNITTKRRASKLLSETRNPERHRAMADGRKVRHKLELAPGKVTHYRARIAQLEARVPELQFAVDHGVSNARHVKHDDGSPYVATWDAARDLHIAENQLVIARRALKRWSVLAPTCSTPAVAPEVPPVSYPP